MIKLSFENNKIIIQNKGTYRGADGELYPYTSTSVEGVGAEDLWNYIKYLETKICDLEEASRY